MNEIEIKLATLSSDEVEYFNGSTLLFQTIEEKEWETAIIRAQTFDSEAQKWVSRVGSDGTITWRRLPIHEGN